MADYLLDTNIIRYWYDNKCAEHAAVIKNVQRVRQPDPDTGYMSRLFISVVTRGEIQYGHCVAPQPDLIKQADHLKFIRDQIPVSLDIDRHVTDAYGELRAWLFNKHGPKKKRGKKMRAEELVHPTTAKELNIDENDLWIAAQAATYGLVFVTNDSLDNLGKAIPQVTPKLRIEDWTKPI